MQHLFFFLHKFITQCSIAVRGCQHQYKGTG
jgi:hypothetical protein